MLAATSVELLSVPVAVEVQLVEEEQLVVSIVVRVELVVSERILDCEQLVVWLLISLSPELIVVRGQLVVSEQLVVNCFLGVAGWSESLLGLCDASNAASRVERAGESRI